MGVLGHQMATLSLKMDVVGAQMGKEQGARRVELVPRWSRLAWLEFRVSWLGSGMDAAFISLGSYSACTFKSQVSYCELLWGFQPVSTSILIPPAENPWSEQRRLVDIWWIYEQPCTFWGSAKPGCSKSLPLQLLGFGGAGGWWTISLGLGCSP